MARVLLLASLLVGCGDAPAPEAAATLTVRGVYVQPAYGGEAILVDHEAIPDRMPAMRMPFRLYTPALLDRLAQGAIVRLTLDSASLTVVDVETLPFDTTLELEPGPRGRGVGIVPDDGE